FVLLHLIVHSSWSATTTLFSCCFLLFYWSADHRHLHSFPTRRSSDLPRPAARRARSGPARAGSPDGAVPARHSGRAPPRSSHGPDRKSTRLNSSHVKISYAVFCLKKKKKTKKT